MRAGRLRERVRIEEKHQNPDQDVFGQELREWIEVVTVWASVEPLRGREFVEASQEQNQITVKIKLRAQIGVTILPDKMRALWTDGNNHNHTYDILYVQDILGLNKEINLMCKERL